MTCRKQSTVQGAPRPQAFFPKHLAGGTSFNSCLFLLGLFALLTMVPAFSNADSSRAQKPAEQRNPETAAGVWEDPVTPVQGPSWLNRRGLNFDFSCFGRTGLWGPDPNLHPQTALPVASSSGFVLNGHDLYRYSCQSCHQPSGSGCGSEIKSLITPVQGTSAGFIQEEMEKRDRPIPVELAEALAMQNEIALRERLAKGGAQMPSFSHLSSAEVEALLHYLRILAGVPPAAQNASELVNASQIQVGALIVNGTCHICHDAVESNRYSYRNRDQGIPALEKILKTRTQEEVLNKVRQGAIGPEERRGRMPVFSYLTEDEVRAVYAYLSTYLPKSGAFTALRK